jgi:hypothetical protein
MMTGSVISSCSNVPSFLYAIWLRQIFLSCDGKTGSPHLPSDPKLSIRADLEVPLLVLVTLPNPPLSLFLLPFDLLALDRPLVVGSVWLGRDRRRERPPLRLPDLLLLKRVRLDEFIPMHLAVLLGLVFSSSLVLLHRTLEHWKEELALSFMYGPSSTSLTDSLSGICFREHSSRLKPSPRPVGSPSSLSCKTLASAFDPVPLARLV